MRTVALIAVLGCWLAPSVARAGVTLAEGTPTPGYVHLVATATAGDLRIAEEVDGADVDVAAMPAADGIEARSPWTCQSSRTFVAITGEERSAPITVTTPPCAERLTVRVAGHVALGGTLRVSLFDEWRRGDLAADVCAVQPDGVRSCRHIQTPPYQFIAHAVFRASHAGEWRVEVTDPTQTVQRAVIVVQKHYPAGEPKVLSTGDSMMLNPTVALRHRLSGKARIIDDVYAGSGISRPFVIDWATLPGEQVRAYRPDATIISLGMGDGRDLDSATCCGPDYVAAYATRVRAIMQTYSRGGKAAVVWLNEPYPSNPLRWPAEAAINAAVGLAARDVPRVKVVDLAALMTPGGTYTAYLDRDGTNVRVRTADGIHLNRTGARIAARLAGEALRRLGVRLR